MIYFCITCCACCDGMNFDVIIELLKVLGPLTVALWALYLFTENNRVKRAQWLKSLFEKFCEKEIYKSCITMQCH